MRFFHRTTCSNADPCCGKCMGRVSGLCHPILLAIERLGIPFAYVTWQLQNKRIQKFIESYDALMQALAVKHQEFLSAHTI